ncbi:MAG TPA: hypothetical protein PKW35_15805, partial [Nannocystaceae bacterium]|nr:hypothetical protein [Nannocystaceae bacterium]
MVASLVDDDAALVTVAAVVAPLSLSLHAPLVDVDEPPSLVEPGVVAVDPAVAASVVAVVAPPSSPLQPPTIVDATRREQEEKRGRTMRANARRPGRVITPERYPKKRAPRATPRSSTCASTGRAAAGHRVPNQRQRLMGPEDLTRGATLSPSRTQHHAERVPSSD